VFYYELIKPWNTRLGRLLAPGFYYSESHVELDVVPLHAERTWEETDEGVRYVKDRLSWDRAVDMEEFLWIKLKAKAIRDIL
jgi:hypothetical protein